MSPSPPLRIAGLTPLTTIDFPGRIAAVVWLRGCTFRCVYCHNADLQSPSPSPKDHSWDSLLKFFERRQGFLDGVVFSGGEPLLQSALSQALTDLRLLGFSTALHTAGPCPDRLERTLPLLDWVGFDVKAPFDDYESITGLPGSGQKAQASLDVLQHSNVPFEIRTTVDPDLMDESVLLRLANSLSQKGLSRWVIQEATGKRLSFDPTEKFSSLFESIEIRKASEDSEDRSPLLPADVRYPRGDAKAA